MAGIHRQFRDAWLARLAYSILGLPLESIVALCGGGGCWLAQALIDAGLATPQMLGEAVYRAHRVAFLLPNSRAIDVEALGLLPARVCRRRLLLPFRRRGGALEVIMANPLDLDARIDLCAATRLRPVPFYCVPGRLEALIDAAFDRVADAGDLEILARAPAAVAA